MKHRGNTILITGGGSGIGRELAREFYQAGNQVVISGRRAAVLDEVTAAHPGMRSMTLDISDPASVDAFAARLIVEHPDLNVLVNNAGIMQAEDKVNNVVAAATIATNLSGPIQLTGALLPHLLAQRDSAIVNVSSTLGYVPFAGTPTYCATKAALHSWTVSLRHQLLSTVVEVIELIPPAVQTELQPGQSSSPYAMPLDAYIAETMALLRQQPTPSEICGLNAEAMRSVVDAEQFAQVFRSFNG